MPESHNSEDDGYVIIERTGAFFVALDLDGNIHMGLDAYREGEILTLPGGGIEASDRNLFVAPRRETRQEFGKHMKYELLDSIPYVFLCSMEDDSLVTHPYPGQRVKLRIAWFVMETHGNTPREQKTKEVLDPRPYKLTEKMLNEVPMRESSRIAIREAFQRKILPKPVYKGHLKPCMKAMRDQMKALLVPPRTYNYHGSKVVRNRPDDQIRRLEIAEANALRNQQRKLREHKKFEREVRKILKPGTRKNLDYVAQSDLILANLINSLKA